MIPLNYKTIAAAALAGTVATAGWSATVSNTFDYAGSGSIFGPSAIGFDTGSSVDIGPATIGYGAKASSGSVNGRSSATIQSTFADEVEINAATAVSVALSSLSGSFGTFLGASAEIFLDIDPINVAGININPPKVSVGPNYSLATSKSGGLGLGSTISDRDDKALTGVGVPSIPGVTVTGETSLNASQVSSFKINDVFGLVEAKHVGTGKIMTDAFSLASDTLGSFAFGLTGLWDLSLIGVGLADAFDADFGLSASYTVGLGIGIDCGDPSDPDDNFLCAFEVGSSGTSPQLTLLNGTPFSLDFGTKSAALGSISVVDSSVPAVPLPATLPLMLAGFGGFAILRRRKQR